MRIQILSLPRTGSAYLREMIDRQLLNLPNYYIISEPFNNSKSNQDGYQDREAIIEKIRNADIVLVKNHIHELEELIGTEIMGCFCSFDWYTICLLRKNIFEMTLSRAIALQTDVWEDQNFLDLKLTIDNNFFEDCLHNSIRWIEMIKRNALNFTYNKIVFYEELTFNSRRDFDNIGLPFVHQVEFTTTKTYSKEELVLNYEELKQQAINILLMSNLNVDGVSLKCL